MPKIGLLGRKSPNAVGFFLNFELIASCSHKIVLIKKCKQVDSLDKHCRMLAI